MSENKSGAEPQESVYDSVFDDPGEMPGGATHGFPFEIGGTGLRGVINTARMLGFMVADAAIGLAEERYNNFRMFKWPAVADRAARIARKARRAAETAVGFTSEALYVAKIDYLPEAVEKAKKFVRYVQRTVEPKRWH